MPSVGSQSPTAFAMTAWGASINAQYGVTDNLDVRLAFTLSMFDGRADDHGFITPKGEPLYGKLELSGVYYHPELGVRYKLWGGYNLAPYIEAQVGYLWATYHGIKARFATGGDISGFDSFAEGTPTLAAGLAADYRLFNTFFLGAAVRFVQPLRDQYFQHYVTVPVTFSFYWF